MTVRVAARFEGPPGFANGGYLAGLLAGSGPAQVTIRRPVPAERDLEFDGTSLRLGDELLAEVAALASLDVGPVPVVVVDAARTAGEHSPHAAHHPFPRCFGCGPAHPTGLHCLAGPVDDEVWAVGWTPEETAPPFAWAALDCSSCTPVVPVSGDPVHVLGRIEGEIRGEIVAGRPHAVVAWSLGAEGRRKYAASAILDDHGRPVAVARATWVALARRTG